MFKKVHELYNKLLQYLKGIFDEGARSLTYLLLFQDNKQNVSSVDENKILTIQNNNIEEFHKIYRKKSFYYATKRR